MFAEAKMKKWIKILLILVIVLRIMVEISSSQDRKTRYLACDQVPKGNITGYLLSFDGGGWFSTPAVVPDNDTSKVWLHYNLDEISDGNHCVTAWATKTYTITTGNSTTEKTDVSDPSEEFCFPKGLPTVPEDVKAE